mmetsp:Transcript_7539/g.12808  ORF Transcript_7539/g.12808 Transcript_7539/m.12808 type:complete len:418 (-) Transcript_7539:309-1562(-)
MWDRLLVPLSQHALLVGSAGFTRCTRPQLMCTTNEPWRKFRPNEPDDLTDTTRTDPLPLNNASSFQPRPAPSQPRVRWLREGLLTGLEAEDLTRDLLVGIESVNDADARSSEAPPYIPTSLALAMISSQRQGVEMIRAPPVARTNMALATLSRSSWPQLILITIAAFLIVSLPFADVEAQRSCGDISDGGVGLYIDSFAELIGQSVPESILDQTRSCLLLETLETFVGLIMQGLLFSVIVTKFSNPKVDLVFSSRLCVLRRDGLRYLSFRMAHPQGHFVSSLACYAVWEYAHSTEEGETYLEHAIVNFNERQFGRLLTIPITLTHPLDASSPLASVADDFSQAPGVLRITVTGFDEVLFTQISDTRLLPLSETVSGRWKDTLIRTVLSCASNGKRPCADLGSLDFVYEEVDSDDSTT